MKAITLTEEEQRLICGCLAMGATMSAMGPAKSEGLERYRQLMNLKEKIEGAQEKPDISRPPPELVKCRPKDPAHLTEALEKCKAEVERSIRKAVAKAAKT